MLASRLGCLISATTPPSIDCIGHCDLQNLCWRSLLQKNVLTRRKLNPGPRNCGLSGGVSCCIYIKGFCTWILLQVLPQYCLDGGTPFLLMPCSSLALARAGSLHRNIWGEALTATIMIIIVIMAKATKPWGVGWRGIAITSFSKQRTGDFPPIPCIWFIHEYDFAVGLISLSCPFVSDNIIWKIEKLPGVWWKFHFERPVASQLVGKCHAPYHTVNRGFLKWRQSTPDWATWIHVFRDVLWDGKLRNFFPFYQIIYHYISPFRSSYSPQEFNPHFIEQNFNINFLLTAITNELSNKLTN